MEKTLPSVTDKSEQKPALKTDTRKQWVDFFVSHWFVTLIVLAFVLTIVSLIIRSLLPKTVPIKENSWNGITPGYSGYAQLLEKMGPPLETTETAEGFELKYQSDFLALPNQVVTSKEGTVQFIHEYLKYDPGHVLKTYVEQYGKPDLVLNDPRSGPALQAHVFLKYGVVIIAHVKDGSVEQKWYFSPTDQDTFLKSWGENLSEAGSAPEQAF